MTLFLLAQAFPPATQPAGEAEMEAWQRVLLLGDPMPLLVLAQTADPLVLTLIAIAMVGVGVLFCLLGWKLFTPMLMFIWGGSAGFAVGLLLRAYLDELLLPITAGIATGLFFAWLAKKLREVFVGLLVARWAAALALLLYHLVLLALGPDFTRYARYSWTACVFFAVPCFIVGVVHFRPLSMFIMSATGATFLVFGLWGLFLPVTLAIGSLEAHLATVVLLFGVGSLGLVGGTVFQAIMSKRKQRQQERQRRADTQKAKQMTGLRLDE
jgi:hypothetical protein